MVAILVIAIIIPVITFISIFNKQSIIHPDINLLTEGIGSLNSSNNNLTSLELNNIRSDFNSVFNRYLPFVVFLWNIGMVFFFIKLISGIIYSQILKSKGTSVLPEYISEKTGTDQKNA